jgi:mono/diheme cytochrome c family protein
MRFIGTLAVFAILGGCSKSDRPAVSAATRDTFKTRCAPCHGEAGRGDGPAVVKLPTKPPDFADAAWQKAVGDDELRKAILLGGAAIGKGSAMPAAHDLEGRPELDALVVLVRSFGSE